MGCGNSVSFWKESWDGPFILANKFNILFTISTTKDFNVAQMGEWVSGTWSWIVQWRRGLFVWEEGQIKELVIILDGQLILPEIDDSWCWLGQKSTPYAVKTAYLHITGSDQRAVGCRYRWLWDKSIPLKIGSFLLEDDFG